MAFKDLFSTDLDASPPANRLDSAIKELGIYYAAQGINKSSSVEAEPEDEGNEPAPEPIDDLDLLQRIRSLVLDTSSGATHAIDMLKDATLNDLPGVEEYLWVRIEPGFQPDSKINAIETQDGGIHGLMSQCAAVHEPESNEEGASGSGTVQQKIFPIFGNISADPDALTNPHLSAIMINHPMIHPGRSRTVAGSLFFNSIPGIEMSQCSPFIRIAFKSDFDTAIGMTLQGFAGGNLSNAKNENEDATLDFQNFRIEKSSGAEIEEIEGSLGGLGGIGGALAAAVGGTEGSVEPVQIDAELTYGSGIELFQAPQTLNALGGAMTSKSKGLFSTSSPSEHRQLNPAAPLATLKSLTVAITGLGLATLANKTAAMDFTIHDRSFMRFMSPLIGGNTFGGTSVSIEFGWMHPQATETSEGNAYANFLNSLRTKAEYNIQVANTSLGNDGQVNVSLKLASRGIAESVNTPAGSGITHIPAQALAPLFTRITRSVLQAKAKTIDGAEKDDRLADITQGFSAKSRFTGPSDLVEIEKYAKLLQQIKNASKTHDGDAVLSAAVESINEILDERENATGVTKFNTLSRGLEAKRKRLEEVDIFIEGDGKNTPLRSQAAVVETNSEGADATTSKSEEADNNVGSTYPTLGAVMTSYVGRPLQALGKFDEVQMIFYPFNTLAGKMHCYNLASFTLDGFPEFITELGVDSPSISIKSFISKLFGSDYAGGPANPAHVNYGLSKYYKDRKAELEGLSDSDKKSALSGLASKKKELLGEMYSSPTKPPEFHVPDITVLFETVPSTHKPTDDEWRATSILRIHVFDAKGGMRNSTALLNLLNVAPIVTSALPGTDDATPASTQAARKVDEQMHSGIIESDAIKSESSGTDKDGRELNFTFTNLSMKKIKDILKSIHPSITFGTQFTNVKSVTVSSNTGGAVNQVLLFNAVKKSRNATSSQPSSDLEDVFIIPTSISMQTEGFPLVEYGQKYFVDFGTGTTMDNFYYVTGINHTISPGSFTTSLTLSYNGNATRKAIIGELQRAVNVS